VSRNMGGKWKCAQGVKGDQWGIIFSHCKRYAGESRFRVLEKWRRTKNECHYKGEESFLKKGGEGR